jgi:hypothetical protein
MSRRQTSSKSSRMASRRSPDSRAVRSWSASSTKARRRCSISIWPSSTGMTRRIRSGSIRLVRLTKIS